jgi:phosphoribosyl 1,2-cyclic phosphodiesterase
VIYGGNTSCVEVRADGELIVLDAGSGIRPLGLSLAEEFGDKPINLTLLITHTHWDHIQGFPFFRPAYEAKNKLRILGYEGAQASLASTLAGQMESTYFPIALGEMPSNIVIQELREFDFPIGQVRVQAWASNHPGVAVGYKLFTSAGSIVYLPDNEPFTNKAGVFPAHVTDSENVELLSFIQDCDVLIIDSQYDRAEYACHVGWGHGCVDDVVRLAVRANVKQLFLFHHDPDHDDVRISEIAKHGQKIAREQGSTMSVEAAREMSEIVLPSAITNESHG